MAATPTKQHIESPRTVKDDLVDVKNKLLAALTSLNGIWDDIGLNDEQKGTRIDLVFMYIRNLIDEMLSEEEKRRTTLKENITTYTEQLNKLCAELDVIPIKPTALKLFEVEKQLKQEVTIWQAEKESRLDEFQKLKKMEQALCDIMQETPTYIPCSSVPSKDMINKLRKHTDDLAKEKNKRYCQFLEERTEITSIIQDLGEEIVTDFEQEVVMEDPECFVLSSGNMNALHSLLLKFKTKLVERRDRMAGLKEKITALWDRLEVDTETRQGVDSRVIDHTIDSLAVLEEELSRMEKLKFEHMQEFIIKIREELVDWWNKCYYSKRQRDEFSAFNRTDYSEELLTLHELELDTVKLFYHDNKYLLEKIEKRTELWNKMVSFDEKENDPNRFRNRGGGLLAEEREKKKVLHQLPKVEEQLKEEVEQWEKENGKQFLIGGVQFFEYCRLQWEEYKTSKELHKQQRLEQKEKEMQSEIRFGSKPTPSKRRFCAGGGGTPSQTPKQRKLNDTTRSATKLHSLSKIHSVFTSPAPPSKTPLKQTRSAVSGANVPNTPTTSSKMRTPMGPPPTTPRSLRSSARKLTESDKTKSCVSLASPSLRSSHRDLAAASKNTSKMRKAQSERKLNTEHKLGQLTFTSDDIVSQSSSGVSDVEPIASSYEEFEHMLDSAKKTKQYRSTLCLK